MPDYRLAGPKGGAIIRRAPLTRVRRLLPGLVGRFGRITVATAPTSNAPRPKPTTRQLIVQFAHWGCAHQAAIHYAETRPIPTVTARKLPRLPFTTDCSGFATMAYAYAGAADPNGNHYNGQGYTGTLLAHGKRVPISRVQPGDLAVYGCKSNPAGHHVVIVTAIGKRSLDGILTVSHGQESGPFEITAAQEARYQPDGPAGIVFLKYLP